ncbi:MAG: hypothetical protein JJV90_01725 [Spiroplasma sp.]|nr:hypothetical protein [Mycoplasmatales bacterium]
MSDKREEEIKEGLKKEVYSKLEELDNKYIDETLSSTRKLANILKGYQTNVDSLDVSELSDVLEIIEEQEVLIEVDNDELLGDYNNKIHDFNLDTLSQIINDDEEFETSETEEVIQVIKPPSIDEVKEQTEEFIELSSVNEDIEDIIEEEIEIIEEVANPNEEKPHNGIVEYSLIVIILILIIVIAYTLVGTRW